MTVGKKLFTATGALLAVVSALTAIAILNISKLGDSVQELGHVYSPMQHTTGHMRALTSDMLGDARGVLLKGYTHEPDRARELNDDLAHTATALKQDAHQVAESNNPTVRNIAENQILPLTDRLKEATDRVYELASQGSLPEASMYYTGHVIPASHALGKAGDDLAAAEYAAASSKADTDIAAIGPAQLWSVVMAAFALALGAAMCFIVRSVNTLLRQSIAELRDGADQVSSAAAQVSASSQSLAQGASEQAASLEETSASTEEIRSMVSKNRDSTGATAELLETSQEKITLANQQLDHMVASMDSIAESSGRISRIIRVIDEIAFQTNILALNAAVEAARAGEAGMGFAVVADEVRSLAQRSAQAAKDTAGLIDESIRRSNEGKTSVDQVASAIRDITEDTGRIKNMIATVNLGSKEQSYGIDGIGKAMLQMEQVTQTTAANAEECAAAAEELNAQSETLRDVVQRLHEMVDSQPAERRPISTGRAPSTQKNRLPQHSPAMNWTTQDSAYSQQSQWMN